MTVLVTGTSGMLGAAVARSLRDAGAAVCVLQRRPAGIAGVREVLADVADPAAVRGAMHGVSAVVHLAAKVSVSGRWEEFARTNITGTRVLLQAARAADVQRLVFVSSPSVAHTGSALAGAGAGPADPERARGSYARSKAAAERLALAGDGATAVVAVRPHLVWGPGDTQLVARVVARARRHRLPLLDAGAALVDSTYVDNAASAIVAALARAHLGTVRGRAFVVSNGEPRTVAELFARMCLAAGAPVPSRHVPARVAWLAGAGVELAWRLLPRAGDPPMTRFLAEQLSTAHWFDQRDTRQALGWRPTVSLAEGFDRLAGWYRR